jgi:hypothetical protein
LLNQAAREAGEPRRKTTSEFGIAFTEPGVAPLRG